MRREYDFPVLLGLALLATSSVTRRAHAEEPVRFEYLAPPGCPDGEAFARLVAERSLHRQAAEQGELARTFTVNVTADAEAVHGRVDFVDPDGRAVFRTMQGATCEEVVAGIALVVALAIDARAGSAAPAPPVTPAPTQASPPPPADPPRTAASNDQGRERDRGKDPPRSPFARDFAVGLGAGYSSYEGPSGAITLEGFVGARLGQAGFPVRASARHSRSEVVTAGQQRATFYGYGARVDGCPVVLGSDSIFAVPCLAMEAGVLRAAAAHSPGLQRVGPWYRGYWNGLLLARLGAVVADRLVLEIAGVLAVPFVRHRFGFGELPRETLVFQMPRIGAGTSVGVGLRFP